VLIDNVDHELRMAAVCAPMRPPDKKEPSSVHHHGDRQIAKTEGTASYYHDGTRGLGQLPEAAL
jgi:hypothetical protein